MVVYKVDRLSRSLLDFARMMETFERFHVSFVSVTQHFNTATSMGRLILNVLLSFAQFEREMISERTRDKMAAARRKGKWLGGVPALGYDVDRQTRRLVINHEEAAQVQSIFELYPQLGGLVPVVEELARRGWVNKQWTNRNNVVRLGKPFNKGNLHYILTNVTYRGRVKFEGEIYPGEHPAIVSDEVFERVQSLLGKNRRTRKLPKANNGCRGVLEGLLYCAACESRMIHTYTSKETRRYRYYLCSSAQKTWQKRLPFEIDSRPGNRAFCDYGSTEDDSSRPVFANSVGVAELDRTGGDTHPNGRSDRLRWPQWRPEHQADTPQNEE